MIIKTFSAKTLQGAKEEAYRQLGPQAIILNTRQYAAEDFEGENFFEVTVAIEQKDKISPVKTYSLDEIEEIIDRLELSKTEPLPEEKQNDLFFSNLCQSLWQELSKKEKDPFESLVDHLSSLPQPIVTPEPQNIKNLLVQKGVEEAIATMIQNKIAKIFPNIDFTTTKPERYEAIRVLWRELLKIIRVYGPISFDKQSNRSAKIVALVGKRRTDKSLVAAKLAYQYGVKLKKNVLIISLEKNPAAPLKNHYTDKIPCQTVFKYTELETLLQKEMSQKDLIIIDCFGCRMDSWHDIDILGQSLGLPLEFETHLVIDALTKNVDAQRIVKNYLPLSPVSFILTGFNETYEPGLLVNLCVNSHLPISYIMNDEDVSQPLEIADTPTLARYLLIGAIE